MTGNKLCIFTVILLQFMLIKCQTTSHCGSSGTVEMESCTKYDTAAKETQNEEQLYSKDTTQQQQSWLSTLYTSVTNSFSSITNVLVQQYSSPDSFEATDDRADSQPEDVSDKELMKSASAMVNEFFHIDSSQEEMLAAMLKEAFIDDGETIVDDSDDRYEYPPVYRIDPGNVGDIQYVETEEGVKTKLITRAVRPPLFEIPDFMSAEDCDYIIEKSREKGLNKSAMFMTKERTDSGNNTGSFRESFSSHLRINDVDENFISTLHDKLSVLIGMPKQIVQWSEHLAIGMYKPGGHYHAHQDSNEASRDIPCCFQTKCEDKKGKEIENKDCCRLCRYVTVLYYLNDVEEGGETAFPLADLSLLELIETGKDFSWQNLTSHCHDAPVVIKPEKGKAVMWYNNFVDSKGYLSAVDRRSYHGGCEVIKGTKWIATNWISTPTYSHRFKPSKYRNII